MLNLLLYGKKEKAVNKAENRRSRETNSGANLEAGKQHTTESQIIRCIPALGGQDHRSRILGYHVAQTSTTGLIRSA